MIQEVLPNIFLLPIPLPMSPLKVLNSYLIRGADRSLLIDTGFNRRECKEALFSYLSELDIDIDSIDLFITHMHNDHCGLAFEIASDNSIVYCNSIDMEIILSTLAGNRVQELGKKLFEHGYPEIDLNLASDLIRRDISEKSHPSTDIKDEDVLHYGGYELICLTTPGHTPGHCCLYEPTNQILFGGDLLLSDITPNIGVSIYLGDDLGQYIMSLERINKLDIQMVLPGHRSIIKNYKDRISEILMHHEYRMKEILQFIGNTSKDAFQVAGLITWDSKSPWNELPMYQKWFATAEVIAHLEHMALIGLISKVNNNNHSVFQISR